MMNEKKNNTDVQSPINSSIDSIIKRNKLEDDMTFSKNFTQYNISTGRFFPCKSLKYINQFGGIPIGTFNDNILVDSSDAHSIIMGATGSKKSRLVIMPSVRILADAGESMIISDPKAEIYHRTSGCLEQKGYTIKVINFRDPLDGDAWNPLYIPYLYYSEGQFSQAYEFVNDIADNLMTAEKSVNDPFWDYSSRDLLFGLIILLFKYCKNNGKSADYCNISNILRLRSYLFKNYYASGKSVINDTSSTLYKYMNEDFIALSSLMGTISAPEKTQSSILCTFDEKMRCFAIQSDLLSMLSNNNIELGSIENEKIALFIIMPDEKTTYHKLVSLFIKQSYEYLIYRAQKCNDGYMPIRINYILDEFSSLPAIKDFSSMISAARSRNIRFNLVIQSKNQLIDKYRTEAETIQSNCSNWIFLTSRERVLLEEISQLCGRKSDGTKLLIPLEALQHFNKEKGEALILSGRLYPYITRLEDIKKYDKDNILKPIALQKVVGKDNILDFAEIDNEKTSNSTTLRSSALSDFRENDDKISENIKEYDLQKELELKFDELFVSINEEN